MAATKTIEPEFPDKLRCLFGPARYKVLYGGRGGAKSWGIARALLIIGAGRKIRVLCAREIQSSIKDSVHKLLSDQIASLGLSSFYEIQQSAVIGKNGTEFAFVGLRHNVDQIKSFEGIDICWVEEAQTVSKGSWDTLIPTIRKDGSEIWISFNPEFEQDETNQRFVVKPPANAVVKKLTWRDNPWFPKVLRAEKDALRDRDPDAYLHVWEGGYKRVLEGAVYAKELRAAETDDRITKVPYERLKPVDTFWDLGKRDATSIWFAQVVGFEYRVIDFYENRGYGIDHYLKILQEKPYLYGRDYLPHDANMTLVGQPRSIKQQMQDKGRKVDIVPKLSKADGINAARTIFPNCYFDAEKCAEGLHALRHYKYEVDQETGLFSKEPAHDWSSHAADAFRYMGVSIKDNRPAAKLDLDKPRAPAFSLGAPASQSWMA